MSVSSMSVRTTHANSAMMVGRSRNHINITSINVIRSCRTHSISSYFVFVLQLLLLVLVLVVVLL